MNFSSINRSSNSISYSSHLGIVGYASNNHVCLFSLKTKTPKPYFTNKHSQKIIQLAFLNNLIVSISADKSTQIHAIDSSLSKTYQIALLDKDHLFPISTLACFNLQNHYIIATSSNNLVWIYDFMLHDDGLTMLEGSLKKQLLTIKDSPKRANYPMTMEFAKLPNSNIPALFTAGTENTILIYSQSKTKQFDLLITLHGHTDWIRSISLKTVTKSTGTFKKNDLVLASASQDKYIRIWKISEDVIVEKEKISSDLIDDEDEVGKSLREALEASGIDEDQISTKAQQISIPTSSTTENTYTILFDSLLMGHDNWVHCVSWKQPETNNEVGSTSDEDEMELVSCSADKSLMIWAQDLETGVWLNKAQVGDLGGSTLGFYNAIYFSSPTTSTLLGHNYNGALQIWTKTTTKLPNRIDEWVQQPGIAGHFDKVKDIHFDPHGRYLISVGLDLTCRLFAPVKSEGGVWREIGRPQVHGYSIGCVGFLGDYSFVSGADEKILRIFECPKTFIKSLKNITDFKDIDVDNLDFGGEERAFGASLPALGLSNKAINPDEKTTETNSQHDSYKKSSYTLAYSSTKSVTEALTSPPLESHLIQHTLWPEVNKLYGHGYEIIALATSPKLNLIASSSKASLNKDAQIRIWDVKEAKECPYSPLDGGHGLTVVGLAFSACGRFLASCGRDRGFCIFQQCLEVDESGMERAVFKVFKQKFKAHARVIWQIGFSCDSRYFFTCSRDKTLKIWSTTKAKPVEDDVIEPIFQETFSTGVSCAEFSPFVYNQIAVGFENGKVMVFAVGVDDGDGSIKVLAEFCEHSGSVNSVRWRPGVEQGDVWLASCGDDGAVNLFFSKIEKPI